VIWWKQLQGVDDAIDKSKKVLTAMSRRMTRNKWIVVSVIVALILAIILIISYKLSHWYTQIFIMIIVYIGWLIHYVLEWKYFQTFIIYTSKVRSMSNGKKLKHMAWSTSGLSLSCLFSCNVMCKFKPHKIRNQKSEPNPNRKNPTRYPTQNVKIPERVL